MADSIHADAASVAYDGTETPTGRLGIWWFLASEIVIFGGLICCYLLFRWRHPEWGAEAAHTINAAGAFNTLVLLTSSLTVVLAHHAASHGDNRKAANYLSWTLVGGLIFLCVKVYEYAHEIGAGFVPEVLNTAAYDSVIKVDDQEAYDMMMRLSTEEGISVGISSGATVCAALQAAKELGAGKRVVALAASIGERYLSLFEIFQPDVVAEVAPERMAQK